MDHDPAHVDENTFNTLYEHLVNAKDEAVAAISTLETHVLRDLGEKLESDHSPMVMSKAVFLRWEVHNILGPFLAMCKLIIRELQDSDYYLIKTLEQIEFLSQEYAAAVKATCKQIGQ